MQQQQQQEQQPEQKPSSPPQPAKNPGSAAEPPSGTSRNEAEAPSSSPGQSIAVSAADNSAPAAKRRCEVPVVFAAPKLTPYDHARRDGEPEVDPEGEPEGLRQEPAKRRQEGSKRFKAQAKPDKEKTAAGYLAMVQKLESIDKDSGSSGGKWLVR